MDGTLVDTENLDNEVALQVCRGLGFELTHEEQEERHGKTSKKLYEYLAALHPGVFDVPKATQKQLDGFEAELRKGPRPFSGAKELPKLLKSKGYKLAIVSSSTRPQIDMVLAGLGINTFFDFIVSADDIKESKPNPEGYLIAAKKLGVNPEECVVLEDGSKGAAAGKNAGMKVIGVVNNGGQDLSQADMVVKNLGEINLETLTFK